MAKFDPFLSLDCARVEGVGAQSKERKGSNYAAQRSGAIVQKPEGPNTYDSKNPAIAIWQPCLQNSGWTRFTVVLLCGWGPGSKSDGEKYERVKLVYPSRLPSGLYLAL